MITTVNLFDCCNRKVKSPSTAYKESHYKITIGKCWGNLRKPEKVKEVYDGSGMFDLFMLYKNPRTTASTTSRYFSKTDIRIGLLREARCNQLGHYNFIANNHKKLFNNFKYIYTWDQELLNLDDRFKFYFGSGHYIENPKIYNKTKLVSMVASEKNRGPGYTERLGYVNKFKNQIIRYGKGANFVEKIDDAHKDYMFSLVFENEKVDWAYSEKIMNCFATGTIPIYLGSKIPPPIGLDTKGIIYLDKDFNPSMLTENLYYDLFDSVKHNFEVSQKYAHLIDYTFGEGGFADEWLEPIRRQHANT